jgi:hypothetical protein
MRILALLALSSVAACSHLPWDYPAQEARISACYHSPTPDGVTECLAREEIKDPAYPTTFKPGSGAFCSPDLDARECRSFLETANTPQDPSLDSLDTP